MTGDPTCARLARARFAQILLVLAVGLMPLPVGWARARSVLNSLRSPEPNRADREANPGGYYQSLIGADGPEGASDELALRLVGKRDDWGRVYAAHVRQILEGDPLMFELRPNTDKVLFGERFTTNAFGLRGRPTARAKPDGTFRVAVLGSSIDMGWGVDYDKSWVILLENWLNAHAARRGLDRRFEVLNFAVAAYSPVQRLESFRRKAVGFHPDLVIYSATMLDPRLIEIHFCDMLQSRVRFRDGFLRKAMVDAGITADDIRLDTQDKFLNKNRLKRKLKTQYWPIYDATMRTLAAECRSEGVPLVCTIIPRVGKADVPEARAETVARMRAIFDRYGLPVFDLSGTFDDLDPAPLEIAAWDDHPNALGHYRLFRALANQIKDDPLYDTLFQ
jgi:hypothetical protein